MAAARHLRSVPAPTAHESGEMPALRAKTLPRNLSEERRWARETEITVVAPHLLAISDSELAHAFGSENDVVGARLKSGGAPMTPGELALLPPARHAVGALVSLARERVAREACDTSRPAHDPKLLNLRLLLTHLDACAALLTAL
jgi:hypothetical protein